MVLSRRQPWRRPGCAGRYGGSSPWRGWNPAPARGSPCQLRRPATPGPICEQGGSALDQDDGQWVSIPGACRAGNGYGYQVGQAECLPYLARAREMAPPAPGQRSPAGCQQKRTYTRQGRTGPPLNYGRRLEKRRAYPARLAGTGRVSTLRRCRMTSVVLALGCHAGALALLSAVDEAMAEERARRRSAGVAA